MDLHLKFPLQQLNEPLQTNFCFKKLHFSMFSVIGPSNSHKGFCGGPFGPTKMIILVSGADQESGLYQTKECSKGYGLSPQTQIQNGL